MALTQVFAAGHRPSATQMNEASIPVVSATADITAPYAGQIIFNTSDTRLYRNTNGLSTGWVVFSGGPTWALYRSPSQSIPNNAWTDIQWDAETVDTGNVHSTSVNITDVTITQDGLYAVSARGSNINNGTGVRGVKMSKNGTDIIGSTVLTGALTGFTTAMSTPTLFVPCVAGDVLKVQQYQNSGAGLNTGNVSPADYPLFNGTWLRD